MGARVGGCLLVPRTKKNHSPCTQISVGFHQKNADHPFHRVKTLLALGYYDGMTQIVLP